MLEPKCWILVHDAGTKVLVDACQSVPHMVVDVRSLDADFLVAYSHKVQVELSNYLYDRLSSVPNVCIYRLKPSRSVMTTKLCSFTVEDVHPTDIATFLDQQHGLAIRSSHHCAQALHRYLGVNASARASLHFYNTKEDFDDFIWALSDTIDFFCIFQVESCIRRRTRI